ncbi:MAG TPA: hypothetical protein PKL88_00580 [bacterium]|nr:hypothetical protein [bacterium]
MKLPSFTKFMDIKSREDYLGPAKIENLDPENLPVKEIYLAWQKEVSVEEKISVSKRYSRSLITISIVVGLILLIMQQFFVLLILGSIAFFVISLKKVSSENVKYELSNHGIMIDDSMYYWDKLRRFFFLPKGGTEILVVDTTIGFPGRIYLSFNPEDRDKIKEILEKYTHYLESEPRTFLDNAYDKVINKFSVNEDETGFGSKQ